MMNPFLLIKEIQDTYLRKNFQNLSDYFQAQNQLLDFNFFEIVFTAAETNKKLVHGLKTIPQDLIVTQKTGSGSVTFNFGLFTSTEIDVTASAACRVRFFIGTYWNYQNTVKNAPTDTMIFT